MEGMRWSKQNVSPNDRESGIPAIKNHSTTLFDSVLYYFGGYDGRRNHLTLLLYSIHEQRWIRPQYVEGSGYTGKPSDIDGGTFVSVTGNPPSERNGHSATLATDPDDEDNGRIIIIGGWLGTGPFAASDMHILDISNGGRQLRWYQPAVKGTPPGPCNMHSADYIASKGEVYVFRGGNGREYLNDLHALNTTTLTWRKVQTTGAIPRQRANHSSALLEETGELFIFGGWNGTERLNDIHILDTVTSTWTCPQVGGILPRPRAGMTLTALRGRLYMFGGSGIGSKCFHDVQIFDISTMSWSDITQHAPVSEREDDRDHRRAGGVNKPRWLFRGHDDITKQPLDSAVGSMDISGTVDGSVGSFTSSGADSSSSEAAAAQPRTGTLSASSIPMDEDANLTITVHGHEPWKRAGHTATAADRKLYIFGGSCGSDYFNDFFVLDTEPSPDGAATKPTSQHLVES